MHILLCCAAHDWKELPWYLIRLAGQQTGSLCKRSYGQAIPCGHNLHADVRTRLLHARVSLCTMPTNTKPFPFKSTASCLPYCSDVSC